MTTTMAREGVMVGADDPRWPAGLSYRRLDYWSRNGFLHCAEAEPGSGRPRRWPVEETRIAWLVCEFTNAGLMLPAAFRLARDAAARVELLELLLVANGSMD